MQKAIASFNMTDGSPRAVLSVQMGDQAMSISDNKRKGTLVFGLLCGLWPIILLIIVGSAQAKRKR